MKQGKEMWVARRVETGNTVRRKIQEKVRCYPTKP